MEAILACHPARSTKWLDCHPKSCELWRIRTGPILFVSLGFCELLWWPLIFFVFFDRSGHRHQRQRTRVDSVSVFAKHARGFICQHSGRYAEGKGFAGMPSSSSKKKTFRLCFLFGKWKYKCSTESSLLLRSFDICTCWQSSVGKNIEFECSHVSPTKIEELTAGLDRKTQMSAPPCGWKVRKLELVNLFLSLLEAFFPCNVGMNVPRTLTFSYLATLHMLLAFTTTMISSLDLWKWSTMHHKTRWFVQSSLWFFLIVVLLVWDSWQATDPDSNPVIRFQLRNGASNHLFSLDDTSGVITLTGKLDYENKTKHILTALAFNPDRPTMFSTGTATITVDVTVSLEIPLVSQWLHRGHDDLTHNEVLSYCCWCFVLCVALEIWRISSWFLWSCSTFCLLLSAMSKRSSRSD